MEYFDIGFSNIRIPNSKNSFTAHYDIRKNTFPEEVYVHEFLHTMERISEANGLEYPILHDSEKYGYKVHKLEGLKDWYKDYMSKEIKYNGENIGLDPKVYNIKPIHENCFDYSMEIEFDDNPQNIFQECKMVIKAIMKGFNKIKEQIKK